MPDGLIQDGPEQKNMQDENFLAFKKLPLKFVWSR